MENSKEILKKLKDYYQTEATRPLAFRLKQLQALKDGILKYESQIEEALTLDLGKSPCEGYMTEIGMVLEEISHMQKHLSSWIHPTKVRTPITQFGSKSYIYHEPHGTVLIIAPWNYPFNLIMSPLVGAIAGGNVVLLKSSAQVPHVAKVIQSLIEETFESHYIHFLTNGNDGVNEIIDLGVDFIIFTGSPTIGKQIMEKASANLTPVVLELGGKSPVIVHADANIDVTAQRLVWGKFLNAGQTCIAPDHVYVHESVKDALITALIKHIQGFYTHEPEACDYYPRIINQRQFDRLIGYLDENKIVYGGAYDRARLFIAPTLMDHITYADAVMQDEIFGPILPLISYTDIEPVIQSIQAHPRPLATYIFTENEAFADRLIQSLHYGGGCVNDTISHIASPYLPFGGNGNSGMGQYHGKKSFETFTHPKSVLKKSTFIHIKLAFPPYNREKLNLIKKFLK